MSDIVERLRLPVELTFREAQEAADEIERLRSALREITNHPTGGVGCNPQTFVEIASKALKGET